MFFIFMDFNMAFDSIHGQVMDFIKLLIVLFSIYFSFVSLDPCADTRVFKTGGNVAKQSSVDSPLQ